MEKFLEEYGFVILVVICIGFLVATVIVIRAKNNNMVKTNYSEFTDESKNEIGGKGLGDGDEGSTTGEGYKVPDSNKEDGELKKPDVMW